MSSDEDLYRRWAEGHKASGQKLVGRYIDQIARFFANKVADPSDAEDLGGRTFELINRKLGGFRGESSFRTYLFGFAHNVLKDYVRAKQRRPSIEWDLTAIADIGPSQSTIAADHSEQKLLLQALREIPLMFQIVLELSLIEGYTQAEIAELLGIPPGTAASRLTRGKKQLRKRVEALAETPELVESTMSSLADWARSIRRLLDDDGTSHRSDL